MLSLAQALFSGARHGFLRGGEDVTLGEAVEVEERGGRRSRQRETEEENDPSTSLRAMSLSNGESSSRNGADARHERPSVGVRSGAVALYAPPGDLSSGAGIASVAGVISPRARRRPPRCARRTIPPRSGRPSARPPRGPGRGRHSAVGARRRRTTARG